MPKAGQKAFSQWGRPCPAGQAVARPGAVHPPCLSEVIGVGVSSLRQSHTFNLHVSPGWDWLPQYPGCLPAILFFAQESLRGCWGRALPLRSLLQGRVGHCAELGGREQGAQCSLEAEPSLGGSDGAPVSGEAGACF